MRGKMGSGSGTPEDPFIRPEGWVPFRLATAEAKAHRLVQEVAHYALTVGSSSLVEVTIVQTASKTTITLEPYEEPSFETEMITG